MEHVIRTYLIEGFQLHVSVTAHVPVGLHQLVHAGDRGCIDLNVVFHVHLVKMQLLLAA